MVLPERASEMYYTFDMEETGHLSLPIKNNTENNLLIMLQAIRSNAYSACTPNRGNRARGNKNI
jgi:hypothetical protein